MGYTFETIQDFYDQIEKSLNPKVRKMMVYTGYQRDEERREKEKKVSELFKESPPYHSYATYVTDDIYVLTSNKRGNIIGYMPYVTGMKFQRIMFDTFDKALLAAICIKYSGETDAAGYIFKMIDM